MNYFDFVNFFGKIEEYRLKKASKINEFLTKISNNFYRKIENILDSSNYFLIFNLSIILAGILLRSISPFENLELISQENQYLLSNQNFNLIEFINNILAGIIEKYFVNKFFIAELLVNIQGIFTMLIINKLLKNSIFGENRVGRNLFILTSCFGYFIGFNFTNQIMFNYNKHYLISLYLIYLSLLLTKSLEKKTIYYFLTISFSIAIILTKIQGIFLILGGEFFIFFYRDKIKNYLFFFLRLCCYFLMMIGCYCLINKGLTIDIFYNELNQWQFFFNKFFTNNVINEIYKNHHPLVFFDVLSREIQLIFLLIFCYHKILRSKFENHSLKDFLQNNWQLSFFWMIFLSSSLMLFFDKNIDYKSIEIFCLLNFSTVILIFFEILFSKKINFKKHGIVLGFIAILALSDRELFFEIFYYLPNLWFIFFIIFSLKFRSKIIDHTQLNFIEKFFVLRDYKSLILLFSAILIHCFIALKLAFYFSFLFSIFAICWMIVMFNNINHKILKNNYLHFFLAVFVVVNFIYFFGLIITNLNIYGEKNRNYFSQQHHIAKIDIINKINDISDRSDKILIISSPKNSLRDITFFLPNNNISFLELPSNYFNLSSFNKDSFNNLKFIVDSIKLIKYKIIIIENSSILNKFYCSIPYLEELNKLKDFSNAFTANYNFFIRISVNSFVNNDISFFNVQQVNSSSNLSNFLIYDYEIYIRK
jgi:hypothetical protein